VRLIISTTVMAINFFFTPVVLLALIAADTLRRKNTDTRQKTLLLLTICANLICIFLEISDDLITGKPGSNTHSMLYVINFVFFVVQIMTFSFQALFMDYMINKSVERMKKIAVIFGAVTFIYLILLLFNANRGYFFDVTPENVYVRGYLLHIRVAITFIPLLVMIIDFINSRKMITKSITAIFIGFIVPSSVSALIDIFVYGSRLLWPCFASAMLFAYLFIIRSDYRLDALTSLNSRLSLNEYLDSITKTAKRKPYTFFMLDMDKFKDINDVFGHSIGDKALVEVAELLRSAVRQIDFVARFGGDEFVIIIKECADPDLIVSRIYDKAAAVNAIPGSGYKLSFSMGYDTYYPDSPLTAHEFMIHVDSLMYVNKVERRQV